MRPHCPEQQPKASQMHAVFGESILLLYSSKPTLFQVRTSPGEDNSRKGLHLFPCCQISKIYFPVVVLRIPLLLSQLLEGSA